MSGAFAYLERRAMTVSPKQTKKRKSLILQQQCSVINDPDDFVYCPFNPEHLKARQTMGNQRRHKKLTDFGGRKV